MKKVVIDEGHGGWDGGSVNKLLGLQEAQLTLDVGHALSAELKARGYEVKNTRQSRQDTPANGNKGKDLSLRAKIANDFGADIFISIHFNSSGKGTASGFEIFRQKGLAALSERLKKSGQLGTYIAKNIEKAFPGMKIRRNADGEYVKHGDFAVIRETKMPAVLIECGFIDNTSDAYFFTNAANVKKFVNAVADGVDAYVRT